MKQVLFLAQSIGQGYVNLISQALPGEIKITIFTGSDVKGSERVAVIDAPKYQSTSISSRLKTWLKYCFFVLRKVSNNENYSLIYSVSNPPFNSFLGWYLKRKYHCPFVFMDWDLYPQVVEAKFTNFIIRFFCYVWHSLNNFVFPKIDCIITLANGMKNIIQSKVSANLNIEIIPIHTNVQMLKPIDKIENDFRCKYNLQNKFVVLFSGKMGLGHNLQIIVDAAKKLSDVEDIFFVMIGDGEQFASIEQRILDENLRNILLLSRQSSDIFPYSIASGDVGIVSVGNLFCGLSMPSRTYDMMATGTPIIGICHKDDNLSSLINDIGTGVVVSDGNPDTLVAEILKLKDNENLRKKMGQAARGAAMKEYSYPVVLAKYKKVFSKFLA